MRKQRSTLVENEVKVLVRPLRESDITSIIAIYEQTSGRAKPECWRRKLTLYFLEKGLGPEAESSVLARVTKMDGEVVGFLIG